MTTDEILSAVESYYSAKVQQYGATPTGVDWSSLESQQLRFRQLLNIVVNAEIPTLLDFGCGYGALADEMIERWPAFDYLGFDISEPMLLAARKRLKHPGVKFTSDTESLVPRDYVVASGIFNVRGDVSLDHWEAYVYSELDRMNDLAACGLAVNFLTAYSDPPKMRADLYYPDPRDIFDYCKRRYSRFVALLHDYPLYEFTILVRK